MGNADNDSRSDWDDEKQAEADAAREAAARETAAARERAEAEIEEARQHGAQRKG